MEISKIKDLFDEYLARMSEYRQAEDEYQDFVKSNQRPEMAKQYGSLEAFAEYQASAAQYQATAGELEDTRARARTHLDSTGKKIINILPHVVWFRHGQVGFGVAFSNWGGNNYSVEIKPWCDEMPSLDHRHRGD